MKKIVIAVVLFNMLPIIVLADSSSVINETYHYTSNENYNIQLEDSFEYQDDYFLKSSFIDNNKLEVLSSQVAISSASRYGENIDRYEIDYSDNAYNVKEFLTKMKFMDVSTNKYYTLEKEENSGAVAVGHKEIKTSDKTYTLLAIIPRSAGYKQEWVGNFDVGTSGIHKGFKAARDEILRYVKKYIKDNNIKGDVKLWITGHSRGAALSNMLGAFFAGGGIEYFDEIINVTPEDIYCYTYATPTTITKGTDKNIELSVSGYRGGQYYSNDTEGDNYSYAKGGKVDPKDQVYNGIRNYISPYDFITLLPLPAWNYTHYGTDISVNHDVVSEDEMLKELKEVSPYAYNKYINGSGTKLFEAKKFDINTLQIVKDNERNISLSDFVKNRINGLAHKAYSIKVYNDKYQDGLTATAGIYGMALVYLYDLDLAKVNSDLLINSLLYTYLAYSFDYLQEDGKVENEIDAFSMTLTDLLSFITNKKITNDTTIDELVATILKVASESQNEILLDKLVSLIVNKIPEEYQESFIDIMSNFHKDYNSLNEIKSDEVWKSFFKSCVYGVDPSAKAYDDYKTAMDVRKYLYQITSLILVSTIPNGGYDLATTLFVDEYDEYTGAGTLKDLVDGIYPLLLEIKDEEGNITKTFNSFAEVADYNLNMLIDEIFEDIITDTKDKYNEKFQADLRKHVNNTKNNISKVREAFTYFFLYEEGEFSTEKIISNIVTFISNPESITLPHYNEEYIAYAKAYERKNRDNEEYIVLSGANQKIVQGEELTFKLNIEFAKFQESGKVYIDGKLIPSSNYVAKEGSTIITFNSNYINGLLSGTHILKVTVADGEVETLFTTFKKEDVPKTDDNIIMYVSTLGLSIIGLIISTHIYKKKYNR